MIFYSECSRNRLLAGLCGPAGGAHTPPKPLAGLGRAPREVCKDRGESQRRGVKDMPALLRIPPPPVDAILDPVL